MFKTIAIVLALAGSVNAAGFRQASQSASSNGMGNAFTAVANDASAVWYNPSLMGDLNGTNVSVGAVFIDPRTEHINTNGTIDRTENKVHTLPHVYATHKLSDRFSVGLGMLVPFGLTTEWDPVLSGTKKVATKSSLKAIYTGLTGSYKVNDKLSVAAGASYVSLDATMNKMITNTIAQTLEGDGTGTAWQLAANYKLSSKWNFAANYRSQVKIDVDGKINVIGAGITNRDAKTEITLPDTFQLGAGYKHSDNLLFSAEADYTDWTTYDKLVIDYTNDAGTAQRSTDVKYWNSAWAFRVGTEYKVNDAWKLRAGSYYDLSPVDNRFFETRNTCSDRLGVTVGAGYAKGNFSLDFSYLYLKFMERRIKDSIQDNAITGGTTVLNGKYNTTARLPSITVSYRY